MRFSSRPGTAPHFDRTRLVAVGRDERRVRQQASQPGSASFGHRDAASLRGAGPRPRCLVAPASFALTTINGRGRASASALIRTRRWPTSAARGVGPSLLGDALAAVDGLEGGPGDRRAGHGYPVASGRVQAVLEAQKPSRTPGAPGVGPGAREPDPPDVAGERDVGRSPHPERARGAGHRCGRLHAESHRKAAR